MCSAQEIISQNRNVSQFYAIITSGPFEVDIEFGDKETVRIQADSRILQYVNSVVEGLTLNLRLSDDLPMGFNYTGPINILVTVKNITALVSSGSGYINVSSHWKAKDIQLVGSGTADILVDSLSTDNLNAVLSGTSSIVVSGDCKNANIFMAGWGGQFYGAFLKCQTANVALHSVGNMTIWVEKELNVFVAGSGNLIYAGDPKVNKEVVGTGSVEKGDKFSKNVIAN